MGLFDLFKSEKKDSNAVTKELQFDLKQLLEKSKTYETKRKLTKYIYPLEKNVLNIFDSLIIIINSEEKRIDAKDTVSITLINSNKSFNHSQVKYVINTMTKLCKVNNEDWRDIDAITIEEPYWIGRVFSTINGSNIFIKRDENLGITLTITKYDKFLEIL